MNMRTIGLCGLAALILPHWMSVSVQATVIFQDGFEGDTAGTSLGATVPPIGDHYAFSGFVRDSSTSPPGAAASGTKFAQVSASGLGDRWFISPATQTAITGQVIDFNAKFYIVANPSTTAALDYNTFTDSIFGGRGFDVVVHTDGSLQYYDGSYHNVSASGTIHTNQWISTDIVADFTAGTYTANIDGVIFSAPFSGGTGHPTNFLNVVPYVDSGASFFYDNINISQVPEPASLMLLGLAALGLPAVVRRRRTQKSSVTRARV